MGALFGWLQKDNVAELEKDKAKLVEKRDNLNEEINAIDEKIASLKSKV